jgi:hypothetical protein
MTIEIVLIELVLIGIPLTTYLLTRFLLKTDKIRKWILMISTTIIVVGLIGYLTKISFVSLNFDIIGGIIIFIAVCFSIWIIPRLIKRQAYKIISQIILILPMVLSIISATVGLLGVLFIVGDFKPDKELRLDNELIYKEKNTGKAFSGPHLTIKVTKRIDNFDLFERQTIRKDYHSMAASYNEIEVDYKNGILHLETFPNDSSRFKDKFTDTIMIDK